MTSTPMKKYWTQAYVSVLARRVRKNAVFYVPSARAKNTEKPVKNS